MTLTRSPICIESTQPDASDTGDKPAHAPGELLYHLLGGHPVTFARSQEDIAAARNNSQIQECAAVVNGSAGIVRARLNCLNNQLTSISTAAADALGLSRRKLGGGGISSLMRLGGQDSPGVPVEVVTQPVEIQLLLAPHTPALVFTPDVLFVTPEHLDELYELQLGTDFADKHVQNITFNDPGMRVKGPEGLDPDIMQQLRQPPGWPRGSFEIVVPYIFPRPRDPEKPRAVGTSTFSIAPDTLDEAVAVVAAAKFGCFKYFESSSR